MLLYFSLVLFQHPVDNPNCNYSPSRIILDFVVWVLMPCIVVRLVAVNTADEDRFMSIYGIVDKYYFLVSGWMSLVALVKFFGAVGGCYQGESVIVFYSNLVIIMNGLMQGMALLLMSTVVLLFCICCPIFTVVHRVQDRRSQILRDNLITNLFKKRFDYKVFTKTKECAICLEEFTDSSEVTPLPCDVRHYFHTECIRGWLQQSDQCPLCKATITKEAMDKLSKEFEDIVAKNMNR